MIESAGPKISRTIGMSFDTLLNTVGRTIQPASIPSGPAFAARDKACTFIDTNSDVSLHPIPLLLADHRADRCFRITGVARLNARDLFLHACLEVRETVLRHENPGAGDARLTAVHEARSDTIRTRGGCPDGAALHL